MEKLLKSSTPSYDHKEFMRMALLKHEEAFREQVHELHRVYRVQKMLMQNVGISQQQQKQNQERFLVESKKAFHIDYNQQHEAPRYDTSANRTSKSSVMVLERPTNEQVLGDRETVLRPLNSRDHNAQSITNNNMVKLDENEIELTLSLGSSSTHNPRRRRTQSGTHESLSSSSTGSSQTRTSPKNNSSLTRPDQFKWGNTSFPQGPEVEPGFSNGQQNNSPWLFQALSLKLT